LAIISVKAKRPRFAGEYIFSHERLLIKYYSLARGKWV